MRYSIDDEGVKIFDDNDICFVNQPFHPSIRQWEDDNEKQEWAESVIYNILNPAPIEEVVDEEPVTEEPVTEE
jgi:hypothetical protein